MYGWLLSLWFNVTLPGGCIDALPCFTDDDMAQTMGEGDEDSDEGSVVVNRAPKMKANPTIIFPCPNAPPGFTCG